MFRLTEYTRLKEGILATRQIRTGMPGPVPANNHLSRGHRQIYGQREDTRQ